MQTKKRPVQASDTGKTILVRSRWRSFLRNGRIFVMRLVLLLLFVGGFFFSVIPWGRAAARGLLILPALITFTQPPPLQFFGEPIQHTQMTVPSRTGDALLDIFTPDTPMPLLSSIRGGLVVVSGVGDNRQVPQLLNLLESLARTNMVVVHVTAPQLLYNILDVNDEDAVVKAFQTLQQLPGMQGKKIGLIAFSAGVPAICFAAADPRIRDDVASVTAFGGYFNTYSFLHAVGQRSVEVDGQREPWHPNEIPLQVLTTMTSRYLPTEDGNALYREFYQHIPLTSEEVRRLSPPAQAAYRILTGSAPTQVDADIAALPADLLAELDALEISNAIDNIRAPIFLLHDHNDTSLPFTESRAFNALLNQEHHPHRYIEFHIFDHVQVREGLNLPLVISEGSELFSILTDVLASTS